MNPKNQAIGLTLNWRDTARTEKCVRSLLSEGVHHVLIWDNSEDAGKCVRELRRLFPPGGPVTILQSPANLGFAIGVNRGFAWIAQHYPGSAALLINNDAILHAGAVNTMEQALAAHPGAFLVYPRIDHGGRLIDAAYYHRLTGLLTRRKLFGGILYASGCCLMFSPDAFREGTVFDEDFFMYGEDVELGYRLAVRRKVMIAVPEVLVSHEVSASSRQGSPFYEARMTAAHFILAGKFARNPLDHALLLCARFLTLTLRACLRTLRYRSAVPFRTLVQGWKIAWGDDPPHQHARLALKTMPPDQADGRR